MFYITHYTSQKFLKSARGISGDVKYLDWSVNTTEKPIAMYPEQKHGIEIEMLSMLNAFQR